MSTLVNESQQARTQSVQITEDMLIVELTDGRVISGPLVW
jgi:hypothetical protein